LVQAPASSYIGSLHGKSQFQEAVVKGHIDRLREDGGLTYTRMRELVKDKLEELGYPAVEFGLHGL